MKYFVGHIISLILFTLLISCQTNSNENTAKELHNKTLELKEKFISTCSSIINSKSNNNVEMLLNELYLFQKEWDREYFIGRAKLLAEDPQEGSTNVFLAYFNPELLEMKSYINDVLSHLKRNFVNNNFVVEKYYNICLNLPETSFKDIDPIFYSSIGYVPEFKTY